MFMVRLKILDSNENVLANVARSAILRYKSFLVRVITTLFYSPLLVIGWKQEDQHISIPLFDNFIDNLNPSFGQAAIARIEIEGKI